MANALKTAPILANHCCELLNVYASHRPLSDLCELQVAINCKSNYRRIPRASPTHAEANELQKGGSMALVPLVRRAVDSRKHHGAIAGGIFDRSRLVSSVP
jgi:hypothetical protein